MKLLYRILLGMFCILSVSCNNKKASQETIKTNTLVEEDTSPPIPLTYNFLSLSDVHLHNTKNHVEYGDTSGNSIWDKTMDEINTVSKNIKPSFMVYLGDLPNYYSDITGNIGQVLADLRTLQGDFPILYLPGNNDTLEGDYHSFQDGKNPHGKNIFSLNDVPSDPWPIINRNSSTTTVSNLDFNPEFGFYSVDLTIGSETLRVIALNSVIFCHSGTHSYIADDGVDQQQASQIQFSWFENTLNAYGANDNVLIMMHIPPGRDGHGSSGTNMWNENIKVNTKLSKTPEIVQNAFLNVLQHNQSKLRGMLTSHTHLDGLRRIYAANTNTNPNDLVTVSISTPGISVNHNNNPGFKSFKFNATNFDLIDFTTYYAEPTQNWSSRHTYNDADFKYFSKSYTFKDTYNITDPTSSIFSDIKGLKDAPTINGYMQTILGVYTNDPKVVSGFHFDHALDVLYQ